VVYIAVLPPLGSIRVVRSYPARLYIGWHIFISMKLIFDVAKKLRVETFLPGNEIALSSKVVPIQTKTISIQAFTY
jgi:hypothetical protein